MGRKYRIHDQSQVYFVTFTSVNWIDVFIRDDYRQVFIDNVNIVRLIKVLKCMPGVS